MLESPHARLAKDLPCRPACRKVGLCSVLVLLLTGLGGRTPGANDIPQYRSPLALVADPGGTNLYIAEFTANQVSIFDIASQSVRQVISLPDRPTGLAISASGTRLYVTAGSAGGKVHVVDTEEGTIVASLPAGHTPNAPVLGQDERTLYVCNRYNNDVSVIDLGSKSEVARIRVKREPAAASLSLDGRYLFVASELPAEASNLDDVALVVSAIDVRKQQVAADIRLPNGSTSLRGMTLSPEGDYVYVTHLLARYQLPTSQIERGWIQTNAVGIIHARELQFVNSVLLDEITLGAANPWGIACTADGKYLCIAHAGTHEVSLIDRQKLHEKLEMVAQGTKVSDVSTSWAEVPNDLTFLTGLRTRVPLKGNGPRGLTVVGKTIYTTEYFTNSLGIVDLAQELPPEVRSVRLGSNIALTEERRGEMLFHDAQYCLQKWLSCLSCHPNEGRPDGLNWDLMLDGVGNPKNTKSLLLSHQTPPTTSSGTRANAETSVRSGLKHIQFAERPEKDAAAIDAYLKSLKPLPSPYMETKEQRQAAERGKKVFEDTDCGSCHRGELYTNLRQYDVGTGRGREKGFPFDTPTLIEVWRTAPYFHDGRAMTLKELFTAPDSGRRHSLSPRLSEQEIEDLIAFVLSL